MFVTDSPVSSGQYVTVFPILFRFIPDFSTHHPVWILPVENVGFFLRFFLSPLKIRPASFVSVENPVEIVEKVFPSFHSLSVDNL